MSEDRVATWHPVESATRTNEAKGLGDSPTKKRHVIKTKNVNPNTANEKMKSSPLTKSLDFIGRLSRTGKVKGKKQLTMDESFGMVSPGQEKKKHDGRTNENPVELSSSPLCSTGFNEADSSTPETSQTIDLKAVKDKSKPAKMSKKKGSQSSKKRSSKPAVKSHVLTDYYPVRRSSRKTKTTLEKEERDSIFKAIEDKCEDGLSVVDFKDKGRGVVAERAFKKGSFVVEYSGDLIDWNEAKQREEQYSKDPTVGCYMYYFVHDNNNFCVDATAESGRLGRLLNHSRKNPNCKTKLVPMANQKGDGMMPRLIIIAKRDITAGEELTYDYRDRDKETLQSHPWLKST